MDAAEENLAKLYPAPCLIDDELAQLISKRGAAQLKDRTRNLVITSVAAGVFGCLTGIVNHPQGLIVILAGVLVLFLCLAVIKTAIVANAFRKRQYDKVARLMPDAVLWTTFAYPLSYFQLLQCQLIELQLLMLEGRASELEIVTRFLWAAI